MTKIEEDAQEPKEDFNTLNEKQGLSRRLFIKLTSALTAAAVVLPPLLKPSAAQAAADGPLTNQVQRVTLEKAHRILNMEGLAVDSMKGHVTARGEGGLFFIKPSDTAFEWVTADQLQGLDIDGKLIEGKDPVHGEKFLHLEIYRARKDVGSVVHLHPIYSTILSSIFTGGKIVLVGQQSVAFTEDIPFYIDPSLVNTKEKGVSMAKTIGNSPVLLMKNHGITTVGKTIEEAVMLAIKFENSVKDHLMATQYGKPSGMNPSDAKTLAASHYSPANIVRDFGYFWEKFKKMK